MKGKSSVMEKLAEVVSLKLNKHLKMEGIELIKLKLGVEIIFINISKLAILFLVSYYFGLIKETIIMLAAFGFLRSNAFGLHAKNSIVCTVMSLLMFVLGAYLSKYLLFNNYMVLASFIIVNLLLFRYAPGDTEAHPLVGAKLRDKLKKQAVLMGMLLMAITLIIPDELIKTCISLSSYFEIISILPITYKVLGRRYKNYYEFERTIKQS
ncbi:MULTISPECIES: accessory gene regulator ArgB-like protein [Clostridium]|uniref:Putative AgrB-like protein n=1 Tax=Clostridium acetobutylicum (strain ATCC 824 / DSM 792 / JCM 1419 / IAM 19013 / LMG 5710 / NBRC 13948 / NRRL B-527 / VKM B-1787 / 2291 / W) TaxID=272562 RepID=AGRB_CLOAB|nr:MULTISPECIES: accessory gene regulator ArgB-like protein [Clostridium]Q97MW3.1 RecName: Full=Putative AgrB-like protein [Clostridium acetobutylicum ATCC 824]AAK78063.1 Accessory gene regulator protein B [Clostridium acetobutylicum ATCC 824]ADZ19121.1 putative accessory gene regulator protein [Clostridium acetobutylicum EA 2018]AEI31056.1 putative accessory regulator protein [Clostridium acetobutylicum DSM 1731]AWV81873.1 accessory gene regulator ArgB-like protein [Clostridium acetobutylicum